MGGPVGADATGGDMTRVQNPIITNVNIMEPQMEAHIDA